MGADGQVIKPVPEQSFIQKYWMYIIPALIILRKYYQTTPIQYQ
jgi:hypothetical protein